MRPLPPAAGQFWCTLYNVFNVLQSSQLVLVHCKMCSMCIRVSSAHLCTLHCTLECCSVLTIGIAVIIIVIFGLIIVNISFMFCCCYHHNHSGQFWSKLGSCSALTVPIIIIVITFIIIIVIRVIAITVIVALMSSATIGGLPVIFVIIVIVVIVVIVVISNIGGLAVPRAEATLSDLHYNRTGSTTAINSQPLTQISIAFH